MLKCFESQNHDRVPICEAFPFFFFAVRMFLAVSTTLVGRFEYLWPLFSDLQFQLVRVELS